MDTLGELPQHCGEDTVQQQWAEWAATHSQERLLAACYVLDSRQALLLGRRMHVADAAAGLELCAPVQQELWDASTAAHWAQRVRARGAQTASVARLLDGVGAGAGVACDSFQSALVLACHASSSQQQQPTHAAFDPARHARLSAALVAHPSIQIMHGAARLVALAPFRALVATASESWFFSRKLAGDAREAADEFRRLRRRLREWTDGTAPSAIGGVGAVGGRPEPSAFLTAVGVALDIVRQAVAVPEPHLTLSFGPEMALHVAALALWAATFAGLTHPRGGGAASRPLPRRRRGQRGAGGRHQPRRPRSAAFSPADRRGHRRVGAPARREPGQGLPPGGGQRRRDGGARRRGLRIGRHVAHRRAAGRGRILRALDGAVPAAGGAQLVGHGRGQRDPLDGVGAGRGRAPGQRRGRADQGVDWRA